MSVGAIVIPFVALAVCLGGMWFAWRLVGHTERLEGRPQQADAPAKPASAASGTRTAGAMLALAGATLGSGGIAYAIARAWQAESPLLAAALAPAVLCLAVGGIWRWRARRRAGRSP